MATQHRPSKIGAVIIAVMANQHSLSFRRDQIAASDLARQAQQIQLVARESESETRRLAATIETLNSDRDRLYSRVTTLEQGLDSVTGAIARQSKAAQPADPAPAPVAPVASAAPTTQAAPDKPAGADKTVASSEGSQTVKSMGWMKIPPRGNVRGNKLRAATPRRARGGSCGWLNSSPVAARSSNEAISLATSARDPRSQPQLR